MQKRERTKILVDNTSSVPVVLAGHAKPKRKRMFKVEYKGAIVHCESARDAARVAKLLGADADSPNTQPWQTHEFEEFVDRLQFRQRKLLSILLKANAGVYDFDLCGKLEISGNRALAGVLSGITKVANAMNIEPQRVYKLIVKYDAGLPKRMYFVTSAFAQAAIENEWPSVEDLEWR